MGYMLVTIRLDAAEDFSSVKHRLGLHDSEVDSDFGLIEISPGRHLFTILVDPRAAARVRSQEGVMGVFANSEISALDD